MAVCLRVGASAFILSPCLCPYVWERPVLPRVSRAAHRVLVWKAQAGAPSLVSLWDGTDGLGLLFLLAVFSLGFRGPPGLLLQLPQHLSCPLRIADGWCTDTPLTSSLDIRLVIRWNHAAAALAAMDGGQDVMKQKNVFWQRGRLLVKTGHVEVGVQFLASTEAWPAALGIELREAVGSDGRHRGSKGTRPCLKFSNFISLLCDPGQVAYPLCDKGSLRILLQKVLPKTEKTCVSHVRNQDGRRATGPGQQVGRSTVPVPGGPASAGSSHRAQHAIAAAQGMHCPVQAAAPREEEDT